MFALTGKVAVITGAASGIGLAAARRFRAAGAQVVLADIADASALAQELDGMWVRTDVGEEEQVQELMRKAANSFGKIDICVNNAGIGGTDAPLVETIRGDIETDFAVNSLGTFFGMKHVLEYMPPGGAIVNTASIAGVVGYPTYAAYAASKWAVVGLTKVAALEYGARGIRVNCVCPSTVDTPMLQSQVSGTSELAALQAAASLLGLIQPDHVAAAMQFLVADDCPLVTGQALVIDGGATAGVSLRLIDLAYASRQDTEP